MISRPYVRNTASHGAFLVVAASGGKTADVEAADAYARIAETIATGRMEIVQERVFGSLNAQAAVMAARREALHSRGIRSDGPLTYVEGQPTWGEGFAGVILRAVAGLEVRTVLDDGAPCGRAWQNDDATFVILQNVRGLGPDAAGDRAPASQARRAMERADRLLRGNGLGYRHAARTWFYLSDILGWYADFNRVRTAAYGEFGLLSGPADTGSRLPASTGIHADLPGGAACALDLLAVGASRGDRPIVEHVRNPLQQDAFQYGSAFSRCAVVRGSRESLIEVSGTAAIDAAGKSLYPGDVRAQVRCTLERVASVLEPSGASIEDICAATIFVKNGEDAAAVRETLADLGLEQLPAVWVVADVCRDELLFEIDAEAVVG